MHSRHSRFLGSPSAPFVRVSFFWRACAALLCALPPSLVALDPGKSIFQFNVQNWTRHDGLPSDKINTVIQTADGYIWLGTQRGLVRYDGSEFKEITPDFPDARGVEVLRLAASASGAIRLAINQGGFGTLAEGAFGAIDDPRWPRNQNAKTIFEARDGSVWLGSNLGFGRWVPGHPEKNLWIETAPSVRALCEDPAGRIWVASEDRGLFYFADEKLTPVDAPALRGEVILALSATPEGRIWVGTGSGLRCFEPSGEHVKIAAVDALTGSVSALLTDRQGTLWIAGSGRGLLRFRDGQLTQLRKTEGLASDFVTSLHEDAEGSLWVGTRDGLSQLTDVRFPIYSSLDGISEGTGHTVSASRRGGVWVTTSTGVSYVDGTYIQRFGPEALPGNRYIKLGFEARNGDFYMIDGDRTISVLSGGRIVASYPNDVWPEAITEDAESVVVGLGPTLCRIRNGKLEPYVFKSGHTPHFGYFDNLAVSRDGAIWAASYNGIIRVKDGEYRQWSIGEGLSNSRVHFVFEDADGSIWAGLPTGLARIKNNAVTNLTSAQGLPTDRIYAIVPDTMGYFWLASARGIVRVSRQNLNAVADGLAPRLECEVFDGLESLKFSDRTEQGYSGCRTSDGRVWFPNPQGVVMIDPAGYFKNQVAPPVHIQDLRVDGKPAVPTAASPLEVEGERIEFDFAALSFLAPKKVQSRYQLVGYDADWIDAGSRRSVLYSNLPPGGYTFRVQARNADGVWNTAGASLAFDLPPRFHQTGWFYAICVGAVILLLVGAHRARVRLLQSQQKKLRTENDRLEDKVARRTDELANYVSLLKATIESTADGILALHFSGEIISFNTQFATMWDFLPEELARGREASVLAAVAAQVKDPKKFFARIESLRAQPDTDGFDVLDLNDGRTIERYLKPQRIEGKCVGIVMNFRDITARKQGQAQLDAVNKQLVEASRHAGMAEIATNVLHNVGNVLNSVNVSATLAIDGIRGLKSAQLRKVAALLQEHGADLASFLTTDSKGQKIPRYLELLGQEIEAQQTGIGEELSELRRNVEHIKEIVAMQQNYTRVSGVAENVLVTELVDDAVRMNSDGLQRNGVELVREFQAQPNVVVDRHKVVQILVNLLRNAKIACDESPAPHKQVKVIVTRDAGHVHITVRDNGVGILPENLTRIFEHGFTTRKNGHGFGLHSGALAAMELHGALRVHSDGPGKGAAFTLELPLAHD